MKKAKFSDIWKPHEKQAEALEYGVFEILYGGARGGGKSECGRRWLLRDINNSNLRCLIIRKNAEDLSDWVDKAKGMYLPLGAEFVGRPVEIRFPSGALFRTGHLKDDNAYEKYLGHEYHRMCIEEITLIPNENSYLKLGRIYYRGLGVDKDVNEALSWLNKGVEVGDGNSCMDLGYIY